MRRIVQVVVAEGNAAGAAADDSAAADVTLPPRLSQTGLFEPGRVDRVRVGVASFSPQQELWSDGADKRRWLWLPPGTSIDATDPDRWVFPVGTRLWKQFAQRGRRIETRYIVRTADGGWHYATYLWQDDGRDARLAGPRGARRWPVAEAPGGIYAVPSRADCRVCHESAAVPVLGLGALQLSMDRDPGAPRSRPAAPTDDDLAGLVARGWLHGLPPALLAQAPRVAARSADERAALGYLHANCGHCQNDDGAPVPLPLVLSQRVDAPAAARARVLASLVDALSRYRPSGTAGFKAYADAVVAPDNDADANGDAAPRLLVPGRPDTSALALRMASRHPAVRMPPIGTALPDPEGLALVRLWIANSPSTSKEK